MGILADLRTVLAPVRVPANTGIASPWSAPHHLESIVLADVLGDTAHLPLTRSEALTVPAVSRARDLIAPSIAGFTLVCETTAPAPAPLPPPPWVTAYASAVSPFHRMLYTADDLLFYGSAAWILDRDRHGAVTAADHLPHHRWSVTERGAVLVDGAPIDAARLCLIPGIHEGLLARTPGAVRHAARLIANAERASDNPAPMLVLRQTGGAPMDDAAIDKLIERWTAARRSKTGGVGFVNQSVDVAELGAMSEHLLIDGRNAAVVDVARATGLPAELLDASGTEASLTYSNADGKTRNMIDFGILPHMRAIQARLSLADICPPGTRIRFDLPDPLSDPAAALGQTPVKDTP